MRKYYSCRQLIDSDINVPQVKDVKKQKGNDAEEGENQSHVNLFESQVIHIRISTIKTKAAEKV